MDLGFSQTPIIILAAGDSRRMGVPKGLLDYKGQPFLSHQINSLKEIGFTDLIIVLGKDKNLYIEKVPEIATCKIITNPNPDQGPFSSIQLGLSQTKNPSSFGCFILPIDVPCPDKEVWKDLYQSLESLDANVTIPSFDGRKGHPVLLSRVFLEHLLECEIDSRLDFEIHNQINNEKAKIISVNDSNIILNLNTFEEWKEFEERK